MKQSIKTTLRLNKSTAFVYKTVKGSENFFMTDPTTTLMKTATTHMTI